MARILVHVEGETEETFVREVLSKHLLTCGHLASARLLGNSRQRSKRGGIRAWSAVLRDITNHLLDDPSAYATTMVDYYALPQEGEGAWPGRREAAALQFGEKPNCVHVALSQAVLEAMGKNFDTRRFIPYVVMHEFEGLLFSDCAKFGSGVGRPELTPRFQAIRNAFSSPEEINDSPQTAPSKRVLDLIPGYQKPFQGNIAILEIGLEQIRKECPLFHSWVLGLESLPQ